jgi:hypothetical protein
VRAPTKAAPGARSLAGLAPLVWAVVKVCRRIRVQVERAGVLGFGFGHDYSAASELSVAGFSAIQ